MQYKATITTLTPLHIGTGTELLNLYDLKQDKQRNKTYRLNVDAVLEAAVAGDNPQLDRRILTMKPAELVDIKELRQNPSFSVYALKGTPQSGVVKEQIKNVWGQLYLPGSSLKGALRTVIARSIGADKEIKPKLQVKYGGQKSADDEIERVIFGDDPNNRSSFRSPNYDLLRALQIADSHPVDIVPELINVSVLKGGIPQAPIDIEAIPHSVTFETSIHLDEYLYKDTRKVVQQKNGVMISPKDKLGWQTLQTKWLYNLPIAARNVAQRRFKEEVEYYKNAGVEKIAQIYDIWLQKGLPRMRKTQTFYLQLGWGGGWDNKTMGEALIAKNKQDFAKTRNKFNLGKPPQFKEQWQAKPDDTFPASRRVRVNANKQPWEPLGWVEITLEKQP